MCIRTKKKSGRDQSHEVLERALKGSVGWEGLAKNAV